MSGATGGATGRLSRTIRDGRFAVTAEIGPPRGCDAEAIRRKARLLVGWVDAANVTDNQSAHVRMSSFAGSMLAMSGGVEPVMQLTCRDRNRIALQSDLISAGAVGIPNVLLLTGDHPRSGDQPDAKPVFDMDCVQLVWTARWMRDHGRLLSGRDLDPRPNWFIGAVENPFAPPERFRARRLGKKIAAGAEFAQTQFVFDVERFERWMSEVCDLGLGRRTAILAGVGPVRSLRALAYIRSKVPGIHVPESVVRRLRGVPPDRVAAEGMQICVETIQRLREVPGVGGVHVMAFGYEKGIPEILERSGLAQRRQPAAAGLPDQQEGSDRAR
ncbi:MAG: methylenetetrahydrofolate reductase [Pseudonocardiaceae bacterium]|nr:methylenetetrahydrofolate reductase [Pseudonocardiaceae bacterium]